MSSVAAQPGTSRVKRGAFSAATAVTIAVGAVKIVAIAKEFVVAGVYGRSDALEAFLVAALIPGLLINLVSESMNQALIPTLVRVRELEGRTRAQQLLSNSMSWSIAILVIVSIAAALIAPLLFALIGSQFTPAKLNLAIRLFYGLIPIIVLTGVAVNCTAVLNTENSFTLPAFAPMVTSLAIIILVPIFKGRAGIWVLVYASVLGALIHAAWMVWMTNRRGYRLRVGWFGMDQATREIARQYWPALSGSFVASAGLVVDQSMAAMLPAGSVSALVYAGRFVSVALTLLGGSISSAITPFFSEMVAHRDWGGCRKALRRWGWGSAAIGAAAAICLALGARILVRTTFEHGVFGSQDTSAVASVLTLYSLQIPFFVTSRVFYRFLVAMRRMDLVFYCGLINLVLDIVLNLALMRVMGVAGIALATSLWSISTLFFLGYWTWRVLPSRTPDLPNLEGSGLAPRRPE